MFTLVLGGGCMFGVGLGHLPGAGLGGRSREREGWNKIRGLVVSGFRPNCCPLLVPVGGSLSRHHAPASVTCALLLDGLSGDSSGGAGRECRNDGRNSDSTHGQHPGHVSVTTPLLPPLQDASIMFSSDPPLYSKPPGWTPPAARPAQPPGGASGLQPIPGPLGPGAPGRPPYPGPPTGGMQPPGGVNFQAGSPPQMHNPIHYPFG